MFYRENTHAMFESGINYCMGQFFEPLGFFFIRELCYKRTNLKIFLYISKIINNY